ncbi:MAG: tRNA pseudouridine(38-40) synthase TruA [Clostridiales bacterium]|nr:MAG: tRNA pseudouridine(38-40) synthase TruA [Clostridiales bacterium]
MVSDDFHARYSVFSKEYVYNIYNCPVRSPFYGKYSLFYPHNIDVALLNDGIKKFLGKHDFSSFMASGSKITDATRTVISARVEKNGEMICVFIEADGFLYNMVRIIVGTLLELNEGKITKEDIDKIIEKKDRNAAGRTAPAHGLFLNRVNYG